jgi:hypothetical protein
LLYFVIAHVLVEPVQTEPDQELETGSLLISQSVYHLYGISHFIVNESMKSETFLLKSASQVLSTKDNTT